MRDKKDTVISKLLEERGGFFELVLIAVLLTTGSSMIANYLYNIPNVNVKILLYIGILLCIVPLVIIIFKKFHNLQYYDKFEGFIIYRKKDKRLLPIPEYGYGNEIYKILRSVFYENRALLMVWEKESLDDIKASEQSLNNSGKLLVEATEHYLLERLSSHLSGYFNGSDNDKYLYEYGRNDIPELLLNNRIIDLISKPMEDREKFLDDEKKNLCLKS